MHHSCSSFSGSHNGNHPAQENMTSVVKDTLADIHASLTWCVQAEGTSHAQSKSFRKLREAEGRRRLYLHDILREKTNNSRRCIRFKSHYMQSTSPTQPSEQISQKGCNHPAFSRTLRYLGQTVGVCGGCGLREAGVESLLQTIPNGRKCSLFSSTPPSNLASAQKARAFFCRNYRLVGLARAPPETVINAEVGMAGGWQSAIAGSYVTSFHVVAVQRCVCFTIRDVFQLREL